MAELSKQYDPQQHEEATYKKWEDAGVFVPSKTALETGKKPYVIMLPPPNITGTLHIGHALQDTIMDILIRWHRMMGEPTLWLPGTDHAAIATNKVIESQLHAEGKTRWDVGREEFMKRTEAWYAKIGAEILSQMKRLGCSCDWSRSRFTQDEAYVEAVNEAFIRYYKAGYIYRGARIVNWDPKTQTTVSDLEIDWKTEKVPFYTFKYGPFEISTARPETKFGDKYVVMHPDDTRYAQYKDGDTFEAQWINGPVTATIIKDDVIDMNFGTGVMTITPWHDVTDFGIAQRHSLDMEPIIDLDGKLLPIAGEFVGMSIHEARSKVVEKLKAKGLLVSVQENYEHNVALNDRGKGVIEPQVMRQWFVDMKKLKSETIQVAEAELVRFVPSRWKERFLEWMHGVYDWNINRQIWLGHRLPVWWKPGTHGTDHEDGNFVVSVEKPGGLPAEMAGEWEQDPDVLDTWFSSALWPFATLGWPKATPDLATFYPTSVLVTARDILYLWVARMMFSGLELLKDEAYGKTTPVERIPFHEVFIHPTVLNKKGQRMSKSLGTGVDPLDLIKQYGADATRFGLMYQMNYDRQAIKFDEEAIKSARNFATKLWNLARFLDSLEEKNEPTVADEWIEARSQHVAQEVTQLLEAYKIGEAARTLYDFVWKDFADWYVEILKVKGSTQVAHRVFGTILTLLHPFMPHITEVLWEQRDEKEMLIVSNWPLNHVGFRAAAASSAEKEVKQLQDIVTTIRSIRTLLGIKPGSYTDIVLEKPSSLPDVLATLARVNVQTEKSAHMKDFPLPGSGTIAIGSTEITAEHWSKAVARLTKEKAEAETFIARTEQILKQMQGKADPEAITEKEISLSQTQGRLFEISRTLKVLE